VYELLHAPAFVGSGTLIRSRNRYSPLTDALIFCGAPPKTRLPEASSGQASHDRDEVRELFAAVQIRPVEPADATLSDEPTKLQCDRQAAHGSIVWRPYQCV